MSYILNDPMQKFAVIVAGGNGTRMGSPIPKQFLLIGNKSILQITIEQFLSAFEDIEVIVVLPQQYQRQGEEIIASINSLRKIITATGGETRFHSVKNGLQFVPENCIVFVHDAVRCLVSTELIRQCYESALEKGNAIPAIAMKDSVRIETDNGFAIADRSRMRIVQTPQTFFSNQLKKAFEQEYEISFTDEATVVEKYGVKIHLVEGEELNVKITTPVDLIVAEAVLRG